MSRLQWLFCFFFSIKNLPLPLMTKVWWIIWKDKLLYTRYRSVSFAKWSSFHRLFHTKYLFLQPCNTVSGTETCCAKRRLIHSTIENLTWILVRQPPNENYQKNEKQSFLQNFCEYRLFPPRGGYVLIRVSVCLAVCLHHNLPSHQACQLAFLTKDRIRHFWDTVCPRKRF
jgi:hypothetical protein